MVLKREGELKSSRFSKTFFWSRNTYCDFRLFQEIRRTLARPKLEETLYRVVQTPQEFLDQFDKSYFTDLSESSQNIWDWFQTFLLRCTPNQLRKGMSFLTGAIFVPVTVKIKVRFIHSSGATPRLPSSTCNGYVDFDQRYATQEAFHQALTFCFTETQAFGMV